MAVPPPTRPPVADAPAPGSARGRRLLVLATLCLVAAAGALFIDVPVARWLRTSKPPRELLRLLNFAEVFAHGTGVAALLVVVLALDRSLRTSPVGGAGAGAAADASPGSRWQLAGPLTGGLGPVATRGFIRLVAAAYAGGLLADVVKAVVDRVRPRAVDFAALTTGVRAGLPPSLAAAFDTFGTTALAQAGGSHTEMNSFPSGHAAVAAGFAAALATRYSHAAWCFAAVAILAATQRVVTLAHYPSDVACGAALGLAAAALCLRFDSDSNRAPP